VSKIDRQVGVPVGAVAFTGAVLLADAATRTPVVQAGLGIATFIVLWIFTRNATRADRFQVWTCVAVATAVELFASVFWGVYRYRLGGVPLYVPPGHGLVYLSGLYLSRTHLLSARPRLAGVIAVGAAGLWAVAGLTVLPRSDVLGASFFIYFACFALRSSRPAFFAAIFALTSALELSGTSLADWTWAAHAPGLGIGAGNPPSVIAGAYCVLDAVVILVSSRLLALRPVQAKPAVLEFGATEEIAS
jgi:hypothetical protein